VFVSETVSVDVPLAVAQHRLFEHLRLGDLDSLASGAYAEGVMVFARAGVAGLSKTVEIQSVPAYKRGAITVIPLRWVATGALSGAFPVLDANLELTATDSGTQLDFIGSYRPPLGVLGAALDRLVMHNVARATVQRFAAQLAEVVTGEHPPVEDEDWPLASEGDPDPVG
jgi:hypothetical protein